MKGVERDRHMLCALRQSNCKLHKSIVQNCNGRLVQTLAEIVHNILSGNVTIDSKLLIRLKKYKKQLRRIYAAIRFKRSIKHRRRVFATQTGGFWPLLIEAALSGLAAYAGQKLASNGDKK